MHNKHIQWRKLLLPGFLICMGFQVPAAPAGGTDDADVFLDVIVTNRVFSGNDRSPALTIRTRRELLLDVLVYDIQDTLVAGRASEAAVSEWSCRLDSLPMTTNGLYLFYIVAGDKEGRRVGLYPPDLGKGEIVKVTDMSVNEDTGKVIYRLPRAAFVRVRAGIDGGPYLEPIRGWEVQLAGKHEVPWDGTGQAGLYRDLQRRKDVRVIALAVSIPVNLLARTDAANAPPVVKTPVLPARLKGLPVPSWAGMLPAPNRVYPTCLADDYRIILAELPKPEDGVALFRVECDNAERSRLMNERFELMLFVDGVFIMEDEVSLLPFTYKMATRGLASGIHVITANLVDTKGILGTASIEFVAGAEHAGAAAGGSGAQ